MSLISIPTAFSGVLSALNPPGNVSLTWNKAIQIPDLAATYYYPRSETDDVSSGTFQIKFDVCASLLIETNAIQQNSRILIFPADSNASLGALTANLFAEFYIANDPPGDLPVINKVGFGTKFLNVVSAANLPAAVGTFYWVIVN